jgi:hypothetical protein
LTLSEDEPGFTVRLYAGEPFRFRFLRHNAYEWTTRYGEVVPGGPFAMLSFEQSHTIDTPISDISRARTAAYSDFERVEGAVATAE